VPNERKKSHEAVHHQIDNSSNSNTSKKCLYISSLIHSFPALACNYTPGITLVLSKLVSLASNHGFWPAVSNNHHNNQHVGRRPCRTPMSCQQQQQSMIVYQHQQSGHPLCKDHCHHDILSSKYYNRNAPHQGRNGATTTANSNKRYNLPCRPLWIRIGVSSWIYCAGSAFGD